MWGISIDYYSKQTWLKSNLKNEENVNFVIMDFAMGEVYYYIPFDDGGERDPQ